MRIAVIFLLTVARVAGADRSIPGDSDGKSWVARCAALVEAERQAIADPDARGTLTAAGDHVRFEREGLVLDVTDENEPATDEAWHWDQTAGLKTVGRRQAAVMVIGAVAERPRLREIWTRVADRCLAQNGGASDLFGRYRLDGTSDSDSCGGRIVLAARTIDIPRGGRTLHADVVERTYATRQSGDTLIAEGTFPSGQCAGSSLVERWMLHRLDARTLTGTLDSTWRLAPRCDRPCTVRFRLRATATVDGVSPIR